MQDDKKFFFFSIAICFFSSCSQSNKLTIAFPGNYKGSGLQLGSKVEANSKVIGSVIQFNTKKDSATIFVTIKKLPGVKIPIGSEFIFFESLMGPSTVQVTYSVNTVFLTSKDTVSGSFNSTN